MKNKFDLIINDNALADYLDLCIANGMSVEEAEQWVLDNAKSIFAQAIKRITIPK